MNGNRILSTLILLAAGSAPSFAQTDARLVDAVRLAREGFSDSARAVAGRLLQATPTTDALYSEALYTVALVAGSAEDKRLHLQRLAIEFSQSSWADDARLELAQLAYAERQLEEAVRHIERLLSDYPGSPLTATAALWGSRAALELHQLPLACQWAVHGMRAAGNEIELRNRLEFQRQRCEAMIRADSTTAAPGGPQVPPADPGAGWYVQVAALRGEGAANDVAALLRRAEFDATVVRDAGFYKVRAGPFRSRSDAERELPAIRRVAGGNPFVVQVR